LQLLFQKVKTVHLVFQFTVLYKLSNIEQTKYRILINIKPKKQR
jgi:hypothetical protein